MPRFTLIVIALLASQLLLGCGGSSEEKPTGVIPQAQLDAMQKAKDVESVLEEAEQKRRAEMDEVN